MEVKFNKLKTGVESPLFEKGVASIKCANVKHGVGRDNKIVLVYESGLEVEIPDNKVGLVIPASTAHVHSLEFAGGLQILHPGFKGEIVSMFKVNTDAIPSVYEAGEEFARLVLVDSTAYDVSVNEYVEEKKEEENSEPAEEENAVAEEIK